MDKERVVTYFSRVIVKFPDSTIPQNPGAGAELLDRIKAGNQWTQFAGQQQFQGITIDRLLTSVSEARLLEFMIEAIRRNPTYHPPNFLTYFVVTCPPSVDPQAVVDGIAHGDATGGLPVELVQIAGIPTRPPQGGSVNPTQNPAWSTNNNNNTGFLRPAPGGIGAGETDASGALIGGAWTQDGGDGHVSGTPLQFLDIESDWDFSNPDLPPFNHVYGDLNPDVGTAEGLLSAAHGTCVLGIVAAKDNALDNLGVTPRIQQNIAGYSNLMVSSCWKAHMVVLGSTILTTYADDTPNAILDAYDRMSFGDVLLLELQINHSEKGLYNLPIEYDYFNVIQLGTALGIVIVEAAGNESYDLGTLGIKSLKRGTPDALDSGAIMVSAATPSVPHTPIRVVGDTMRLHNFGERIDCYAWGDNIFALNPPGYNFSGTSGASAIIAGAALSLQGMAQEKLGRRFSPLQVRNILSDPTTGTLIGSSNPPPNSPVPSDWNKDGLGVMPDLEAIVENTLNFIPDIYVRDYVGEDIGGANPTGIIYASPDIILQTSQVSNPQTAFGEGSGTEDDATLSMDAVQGQTNYIYVRVRNRGGTTANVTATVYWSEPSSLVDPTHWNVIAPSTAIPNVVPGKILTVCPNPISWSTVPAPGHYCFVVVIGTLQDPAPQPADFLNQPNAWDKYVRYIRDNNNVAWRNFNVVTYDPTSSMGIPLSFAFGGAWDQARNMQIEVVGQLPVESKLTLQVPIDEVDLIKGLAGIGSLEREENDSVVGIRLNPHGRSRTAGILFREKFRVKSRLLIDIPTQYRRDPYEVFVRQLYQEWEVGRITWRLIPKK